MSNAYRSVLESGGVTPTGDAVAADVLAGKTFSNANAVGVTGTMVNRGAVSETIQPGGSYTIPEGYHNGSGVVTAAGSVVSLGELTFAQLSDPTAYNSYHKASVSTGTTGYNKIAIVSMSRLQTYGSGGSGTSAGTLAIDINPTTGVATITVAEGFVASYEPKATVVVWKE